MGGLVVRKACQKNGGNGGKKILKEIKVGAARTLKNRWASPLFFGP
jgi:hypothetical protein